MTLEQRVDALERRVTRYRGTTMALALVFVAMGCLNACGPSAKVRQQNRLKPFYAELDRSTNVMSYDDALQRWGQPAGTVDGDAVFIVTWNQTSTSVVYLDKLKIAKPISHGWELQLTFDKQTRKMTGWKYKEW
jgi:hypothetical protein